MKRDITLTVDDTTFSFTSERGCVFLPGNASVAEWQRLRDILDTLKPLSGDKERKVYTTPSGGKFTVTGGSAFTGDGEGPTADERKTYEAVNKVIMSAGGKWNRGTGSHWFRDDPTAALGMAVKTGVIVDERKVRQAFFTPPELAARVVEIAQVSGMDVLEPSAGHGALAQECIAQGAITVRCIEIDPASCDILGKIPDCKVERGDFLKSSGPAGVPRICMNPPFSKGQADDHVMHAMKFLMPRGRLVAIVPMNSAIGIKIISRSWCGDLYLRAAAVFHEVPPGSFKESGTGVNVKILEVRL